LLALTRVSYLFIPVPHSVADCRQVEWPRHYSDYYWRHKNLEIDFVVKTPKQMWGIEVKSGNPKNPKGVPGFLRMYHEARTLTVGSEDMPVETLFRTDPRDLF